MTFNQHHPPTRWNSASFESSDSAGEEINLYEDLLAFSELPPEQRLGGGAHSDNPPREAQPESIGEPEGAELPTGATEDCEPINTSEDPAADSTSPPADIGPLGEAGIAFTGALSEGVCLNCGAESGAENLFCAACATFDEEAGVRSTSGPACLECGALISSSDLFCPECGAVLTLSST